MERAAPTIGLVMFAVLIVMGLAVAVTALVILGAITLSIGLFEAATTRRASP